MKKILLKSFVVSVLSGSLIMLNMTALAETTNSNMVKATSSGYTRDSNGVMTKTETQRFEGSDKNGDSAIQTITMLAVGFVGVRLMSYKKWTTDMMVVAAASAAYIAANVANILNLKKQIKDMELQLSKRSDGKIDQTQIETLQKLRESYEAAKKSLQTTKSLQMAAAAIFAGATAVAAYQRLTEDGQKMSCEFAITNAQTELAKCAASSGIAASEAASCSLCNAQLTDFGTGIAAAGETLPPLPTSSVQKAMANMPKDAKLEAQANLVCSGAMANAIKMKSIPHACSTYLATKKADTAWTDVLVSNLNFNSSTIKMLIAKATGVNVKITGGVTNLPENKIRSALSNSLDLFFPRAEAGWMPWLGLGAGAAAALAAAHFKMTKSIDEVIYTPGGRIIAWGIMTGAALLAANATQGEINKTEDHIQKIDQILKELNALAKGIKLDNIQEQQIRAIAPNTNTQQDLQLNLNTGLKTDCVSGSGSSNCASLAEAIKNLPDFANLPESFKSIATQSANIGNGLSGTNAISGSTLSSAGQMAAKQGAISSLASRVKAKINENLDKNGKPTIDFDKHEKNLWNQFKSETEKALQGKGTSSGAMLASLSVPSVSGSLGAIKKTSNTKLANGATPGIAQPKTVAKEKEFQFEFKEEPLNSVAGNLNGKTEEKFDIGENDINTNSGESIFQMISNRYIKSAYPKLLEEIPVKN
jgi:hypothetical protein